MTEAISQIEQLIIMYTPAAFSVLYAVANWVIMFKKLKSINIKEQAQDLITSSKSKIDELISVNDRLFQENAALRSKINILIETLSRVEVQDEE